MLKIKNNSILDNKLKIIWQIDLYVTSFAALVFFLIKIEMPWILKQMGLINFYDIFTTLSKDIRYSSFFAFVVSMNISLLVYTFISVIHTRRVRK